MREMHYPTNVYNFYNNINTGNNNQSPTFMRHVHTGITTGMLLLMWKILFMNFYLSTTSVLQGCPGVAAAIWDEGSARQQSGTGTDIHIYIHAFPFTRQAHFWSVLHEHFLDSFWVVTSISLNKELQYTTCSYNRGRQNKLKINITSLYPAQPK